jgi:hypothetical protein
VGIYSRLEKKRRQHSLFFKEVVGRGGPYLICIKSNANCTNGAKPHVGEKKEKIQKERRTKAEERATKYKRKNMQN